MKIKFLISVMIIALVITAWTPLPVIGNTIDASVASQTTGTLQLVVNNKTGEKFNLVMKGPATYNWMLQAGKQTFNVLPGKYKYTYKACGGTEKTGTIQVKKNKQTLTLAVCKQQKKTGGGLKPINILNNTGGTVTLILTGPSSYRFSLKPGKSTLMVLKGTYQFTAYGCGGASISGTKKLGGKAVWKWWCM